MKRLVNFFLLGMMMLLAGCNNQPKAPTNMPEFMKELTHFVGDKTAVTEFMQKNGFELVKDDGKYALEFQNKDYFVDAYLRVDSEDEHLYVGEGLAKKRDVTNASATLVQMLNEARQFGNMYQGYYDNQAVKNIDKLIGLIQGKSDEELKFFSAQFDYHYEYCELIIGFDPDENELVIIADNNEYLQGVQLPD